MTEMKIPFFTGIICVILGIGIIIGAGVALPIINNTLNDLQSNASALLTRADNALLSAQNAINSTQVTLLYLSDATSVSLPALSSSGELTGAIANNLTSIGSTVTGVGQTLGSISVAGVSSLYFSWKHPLLDWSTNNYTANQLQDVSSRINSIRDQAADVPNRINGITVQLDNVNSTLGDLRSSVIDTQNRCQAILTRYGWSSVLAIVGVMGLGAIFLLLGLSLLSLRHKTLENTRSIYRLYAKYPV